MVRAVKIARSNGSVGTGFFVSDDLVATAGHVLLPQPGSITPAHFKVVLPDNSSVGVTAARCLDEWKTGFRTSADMGILRVKTAQTALVADFIVDAEPEDVTVLAYNDQRTGSVSRFSNPPGLDVLKSSDLTFPRGFSGGPIVDDDDQVVGLATRSASTAMSNIIIGLPLLSESIEWLIKNCPQK